MKKSLLIFSLFSAFLLTSQQSLAKDIYDQCIEETIAELKKEDPEAAINNSVVDGCMQTASHQYKAQINTLYKQIMEKYEKENDTYEMGRLENLQKTWIRYRNNKCALMNSGLEEQGCLMGENQARVKKLEKIKAGGEPYYSDEDFN